MVSLPSSRISVDTIVGKARSQDLVHECIVAEAQTGPLVDSLSSALEVVPPSRGRDSSGHVRSISRWCHWYTFDDSR